MTDPLVKEMALTPEEFRRLLPGAAGALPWRRDGNHYRLGSDAAGVDIVLEPLPPRRIALFTLPAMRVVMIFRGWSEEERHRFVRRFDMAFQKGGG